MTTTIITFDGTASQGPTNFEISEWMDPAFDSYPTVNAWLDAVQKSTLSYPARWVSGGFPANVARRLLARDPVAWQWLPIDYKPGFRIYNPAFPNLTYDFPFKNGSIGRALSMLGAALPYVDGKIVLCGLSQGAWVCDLAFEEFRDPNGLFHSRYSDLVSVVTFGSPRRPPGRSIDLPNAIHGTGQGFLATTQLELSFGTVPGLVNNPPNWMWHFNQLGDVASDSASTEPQKTAIGAIFNFLWDGDFDSSLGLAANIAPIVIDVAGELIWQTLKPGGTSPFALHKWIPFLGSASGDARVDNPHGQYNSYSYTGITGNTTEFSGGTAAWGTIGAKTGVDLAVEYLLGVGAQYANAPATPRASLGYTWWQTPPDL